MIKQPMTITADMENGEVAYFSVIPTDIKEAIEHTKNKKGMKVSFSGSVRRTGKGTNYIRQEIAEHFALTREAWLKGDLETVAEFFGLYV